ncbi:peptide ABC transporter substrate-binding protein [Dehalococcoides mccartyi]|jgi:oligopeptide transport system substrate-binding protein|uniref:Oligopeptide ABC transporter, periplasmic oligopeptide-binding protein OppA n=1 Tax=Dehalococcoides mccartyi TaxID=61435 RepID=A0A1S7AUA6_9CHLR|nr:peptide ABC transporter substrate-binding protein [Dehalococcoides mccartyi]AGG06599.1 PepT transporter family, periplasmic substrate binding protein [Dehalococcoides mccartyi DCMB5]AGG08092.1 PepT transporter family, periplasmic substrate binding protein [Dehalococcoides mccartyi BTF08]AII61104.1 peptide ABC transporter substrate-binding protein [Dehalococcoides mccartyi CG5]AQU06134.1 peptide ABC transporter substrate-binding protein [Dehalococcoides mccartyi]AQU07577.1 peptide ABC transp
MKGKLLYLLAALLIIVPIVFSGCTSDDNDDDGDDGTVTTPQVFRVNLAGEPNTIDPNKASWATERSVIMLLFVGLLDFNSDLSLKAACAQEIPTVANGGISADGLTYTFKVKSNVTWSDGSKVTAHDFEYSIKRMLDPDTAAEYASFYFDIVGAAAFNAAASADAATKTALRNAVGVTAVDDTSLRITLAQTRPTFLSIMALWPTSPVKESVITAKGNLWTEAGNLIGNGPYTLKEWVHQDHMTFTLNTNYWDTKPTLTEIKYLMILDATQELSAYKNGELDMARVPVGTETATLADPVYGKQVVRNNDLTTFAFQFNVNKAPFDNLLVREAMSCAIDRVAFVEQVRGGVGTPAYSWIPPGMPGYDADLGKDFAFNVTKAKQLLADAGYPNGVGMPELKFQYADTASNRTIAQFLQAQLKTNLNLDLTLEPMEPAAFSAFVNSEQHTWAWFGWGADYPDPDNWLPDLFGTGGGNNHTGYSNPAFDTLARQAMMELDNTLRLQMWAQAQEIVMADMPIVTMFYRERFYVVQPYVKGLEPTGMDGGIMGDTSLVNVSIVK